MRLLMFLMLVISLAGCTSTQRNREEADLRLRIGTSFIQKRDFPAAIRELQKAEKLDPKNETVQNNLGLAFFMRERFPQAEEKFRRAVELRSTYSEAKNNLSRVLIEMGRYTEAIKLLDQVTEDLTFYDPEKAWNNLALAYFRKGDFKSAKNKLAEALKINRDSCYAQTLYGRSELELKNFAGAAESLDRAIVACKNSGFEEPHYFSALTYYKLGNSGKATARMEEVIQLYPNTDYAKKAKEFLQLMR